MMDFNFIIVGKFELVSLEVFIYLIGGYVYQDYTDIGSMKVCISHRQRVLVAGPEAARQGEGGSRSVFGLVSGLIRQHDMSQWLHSKVAAEKITA